MSKWQLREEVLRALPVIFGLTGQSNPPQNLTELIKMLYPQYKNCKSVSSTKEYTNLRTLLKRRTVEGWLGAIFGTFPKSALDQCSTEERELAEAILKKYPNGYNALRQKLLNFSRPLRRQVPSGEMYD